MGRHAELEIQGKRPETTTEVTASAGRPGALQVRAVPGLVRPRLHRAGAGGRGADRRAPGPRRSRRRSAGRSCSWRWRRSSTRPTAPWRAGPHQGGRPRLRRPPARRHHRLPQLHVPAVAPDLAGGTPAAGPGGLAHPSPPGQHLRVLPGPGQDRRRLLPGLPLALERGGVLPLRPAAGTLGLPCGRSWSWPCSRSCPASTSIPRSRAAQPWRPRSWASSGRSCSAG